MDLGFLEAYANNPVSLAILAIGTVLVIYALKILPKKIERMWIGKIPAEKGSKTIQKNEDMKKEGFIQHLDKTLERIENKIDGLEKRLNHVDKSALKSLIYNRHIHILDRLLAFDSYLRLGGNGHVANFAIKNLIIPHRDDWMWVIQKNSMEIYCKETYRERIAEINNKISQS